MTEIDFGTLVTAVVNEMNCTTSELFGGELTDRDLAAKRYSRNVIGAIRRVFDEAEAPAPRRRAGPTGSRGGAPEEEEGHPFCTWCPLQCIKADLRDVSRALAEVRRELQDPDRRRP